MTQYDPVYGNISPHDFIPVLEACDKIHLLDYFVAKVTVQNLQARRRKKLPIVPVVLNLSRRDFLVSDPIRILNHLTKKYRLPHIYVQAEITETAFVEDEAVITKAIGRLRKNGYIVTLDNFGEGYSSLAALQRCAIDEISLDRVFFEDFTASVSTIKAGSCMHGIMTAFMNFANLHIHPDDHKRFLHYIHRLTSISRNDIYTTRFDLFRVKMPNGGYHWKNFSLTALRYESRPCQLLCLRDFVFEELPDRDKLINTVMTSYGFTSLPGSQESQITDATLWRTLTQFSHRKLFWKDREGRFCGASPAFLRYYGIQNINELLGKADRDLGWHLSDSYMDQAEKRILKKGEPIHDGHALCIARGRQHAIPFSKYPIYQKSEIVGLLGEFRDVEEERSYHELQRKLYIVDKETGFYNYRGMLLTSVEFADNLRLNQVSYVDAMFVVPEFASLCKHYGPAIERAVLLRICTILKKNLPAATVCVHTGSGVFVLFLKEQTVGAMRTFIE